jgi:hypothetical protein
MPGLVSSELMRLRSRVGVIAILASGVAFVVLLMVGQVATHEDDYEQARATFRSERAHAYPDELASYRLTLQQIGDAQMPVGHREVTVDEFVNGADFTGAISPVPTKRFVTVDVTTEMVKLASVVMCVLAFLAGATAGGAEWQHRTIHGLLTWESRRLRVFAAKVLAIVAVTVVALLLAQMATMLLGQLGGAVRGTTEGATLAWWGAQGGAVLRGGVVVALCACAGMALSFVGRLTAFAIGVGVVYVGVVETILTGIRPSLEPFTIRGSISAFLDGGTTLVLPNGEAPPTTLVVSTVAAVLVTLAYSAVTTAVAATTFRTRDIT